MADGPFDVMPQTPLVAAAEEAVDQLLRRAIAELSPLYEPDGPLPRSSPAQAHASAVGTLMMRLVDVGAQLAADRTPGAPAERHRGDLAILLARVSGYLVRDFDPVMKWRIAPYLARELRSSAGLEEDAPSPRAAPADLPFTPVRTEACNMTYTRDDCYDLPVYKGDGFISSYWSPSAEAKAAIAAGIPVKVTLEVDRHPAIRMEVDAL